MKFNRKTASGLGLLVITIVTAGSFIFFSYFEGNDSEPPPLGGPNPAPEGQIDNVRSDERDALPTRSDADVLKLLGNNNLIDLVSNPPPLDGARFASVLNSTSDPDIKKKISWLIANNYPEIASDVLLSDILSHDRSVTLTDDEVHVKIACLQSIGYAATSDHYIMSFLLEGTHPEFWVSEKDWQCDEGSRWLSIKLAGAAIKGIGISGTELAYIHLLGISEREKIELEPLSTAIVDAAYYHYVGQSYGRLEQQRRLVPGRSPTDVFADYNSWVEETDEGKKWYQWVMKL